MPQPHDYDTLSEAIDDLRTRGYSEDYNLKTDCLECRARRFEMNPSDFIVDGVYRFEGDSNPDDSSILYAISSEKYDSKGILLDAYGTYADQISPELVEKLRYRPLK